MTYNDYQPNPAASLWRAAAKEMMRFIKEYMRIVGWEEIEAFANVKKLYAEAEANDAKHRNNNPYRGKQFVPPWIDRDWRHTAPEWPYNEA